MRQEIMGFWDALASVGPYANNLHLSPDMISTPAHHPVNLYRPDAFPDAQPTVSKH